MYASNNNVTYFDHFGVEHVPKKIKCFIDNKNMQANIFTLQAYESVMCGYFCIAFTDFILKEKGLTNFTNIFSQSNFLKNYKFKLF